MIEQADVQALITRTKYGALTWQTLESGDFQADDGVRYVLKEKRALWSVWPHRGGISSTTESCVADLARAVSQHGAPYTPIPDVPARKRRRNKTAALKAKLPDIERQAKRGRVNQETVQLEF